MRKILVLLISLSILVSTISLNVFSEENNIHIEGLDECLDKICLGSEINAEIRDKMQQENEAYLQNRIYEIMEYPDYAKEKMGLKLGGNSYVEEQIRNGYELNIEKGLMISSVNILKYLNQYANAGRLSYLLKDKNIFKVSRNKYGTALFSTEGELISDSEIQNNYIDIIDDNIYTYINDREQIRNAIFTKGETKVKDIKVFGIGYLSVLYIKCETNEYLIKLYDHNDKILPKIKLYVIYSASEFIDEFNDEEIKKSPYSQDLSELVLEKKTTFDAEAESLHNEGLLQGNENGLDLLKPLTRIEAATMLLRAMNQSTEATDTEQTFSDVPQEHWGFGAAKNAQRLGLVKGVGDNKFAPNDKVTATQFSTMILRASNQQDFDWEKALNILIDEGVISQEDTKAMDLFTRGDMAKIIYEAKQKGLF